MLKLTPAAVSADLYVAWTSGALPSSSTRSVSTATAIVFSDALAPTPGLPTEVAVTVPVLAVPSAAAAGTATLAQTSVAPPAGTLGVVESGVVQVASKKLVVQAFVDESV